MLPPCLYSVLYIPLQPHTYNVCARNPFFWEMPDSPRKQVKFEIPAEVIADYEARHLPLPSLPDPDLIALHAACARVAYLSGAAEHFDRVQEESEDIYVLASDGGSADLLSSLLDLIPVGA